MRFREDPVRMQRAVSFAARLGFAIDPPVLDAIAHRTPADRAGRARRGWRRSATRSSDPAPPSGRSASCTASVCWSP
ncbi:MAG: hypothetical protein MZV49_25765 [Rhodopseudomonas palustris]|nr:hypothetical protein [Rhodopseudomonas palustris]